MTVKVQVGRCYISRNNKIVSITQFNGGAFHGILTYAKNASYGYCWNEDGSMFAWEHPFDIVAEINENTKNVPCPHYHEDHPSEVAG